jgi:two-component system nitrogen regulation sensor histidine kinase GlnL
MTYRAPYPVPGVIWASLPLPTLLIAPDRPDTRGKSGSRDLPQHLGKALRGQPAFDRLAIDAPMEEALWPAPAPTSRR